MMMMTATTVTGEDKTFSVRFLLFLFLLLISLKRRHRHSRSVCLGYMD